MVFRALRLRNWNICSRGPPAQETGSAAEPQAPTPTAAASLLHGAPVPPDDRSLEVDPVDPLQRV